jgi:hypothetical protein
MFQLTFFELSDVLLGSIYVSKVWVGDDDENEPRRRKTRRLGRDDENGPKRRQTHRLGHRYVFFFCSRVYFCNN